MSQQYSNICPNCFDQSYRGGICKHCGYVAISELDGFTLTVGTVLKNRYLVGRVLGIGGFGITYLAIDIDTGERCAIKEYYPKSLAIRDGNMHVAASSSVSSKTFNHGIDVFLIEAQTLAKFLGVEQVVQVRESFQENGTAYFVMEYLDGVNVKALMRSQKGKVPVQYAEQILTEVVGVLKAIHRQGLLHRDISPENIFITKQGKVKLIDFGATRYYVGEASRSLSVILKPGFAPPEQYSSKGNQGPWTDIYALAATFYYVVTGKLVPEAPERLAGKALTPLRQLAPDVPDYTANAIEHALNLSYKNRYQTVEAFESALTIRVSLPHRPAVAEPSAGPLDSHDVGASGMHVQAQAEKPSLAVAKMGGNPYLKVMAGPISGSKWVLPVNLEVIIGRSNKVSNIVINDPSISRQHCALKYQTSTSSFIIRDLSSNGTYLKGLKPLAHDTPTELAPGSDIYLSSEALKVKVGLE
jgi:serine/threonine protein kinase